VKQESHPLLNFSSSYSRPAISNISLYSLGPYSANTTTYHDLDTRGGDVIDIHGNNFGPVWSTNEVILSRLNETHVVLRLW
jgi:hypothetical protein